MDEIITELKKLEAFRKAYNRAYLDLDEYSKFLIKRYNGITTSNSPEGNADLARDELKEALMLAAERTTE